MRSRRIDPLRTISLAFVFVSLIFMATIIWALVDGSLPTLKEYGISFFAGDKWRPSRGIFGALPAIYGTLTTSAIAIAIAVPISLGIAIFLAHLSPPKIGAILSLFVELIAAIPSIIIGFWGMFVLIPLLVSFCPFLEKGGYTILTAGIVLAIMIIPIIAAISRDSIKAVPKSQKEGMLALGATDWEAITRSVLPYARSGIFGGVILGFGRAIGETMAITLVIGNTPGIVPLNEPGATMASLIAGNWGEAVSTPLYKSALMELGLALFLITLFVNVVARLLIRRMEKGAARG